MPVTMKGNESKKQTIDQKVVINIMATCLALYTVCIFLYFHGLWLPKDEVNAAEINEDFFQNAAGFPNSAMAGLSSYSTFFLTLNLLYAKYGREIADFRPKMRTWCEKVKTCKYTDYETEMLYMLVREYKPQNVFEMAPSNKGYTSHWILSALHRNDETSRLHSLDPHHTSFDHMDEDFKERWDFTVGDYARLYDSGKLDMQTFDFIFIDALHKEESVRGYCQRILAKHRGHAIVAIHDIVSNSYGGGQESSELYKYLAFANNAHNVFTMSRFAMPNLLYTKKAPDIIPQLNKLRADLGIVKDCDEKTCMNFMHDPLYINNNDSPTLFFELN